MIKMHDDDDDDDDDDCVSQEQRTAVLHKAAAAVNATKLIILSWDIPVKLYNRNDLTTSAISNPNTNKVYIDNIYGCGKKVEGRTQKKRRVIKGFIYCKLNFNFMVSPRCYCCCNVK